MTAHIIECSWRLHKELSFVYKISFNSRKITFLINKSNFSRARIFYIYITHFTTIYELQMNSLMDGINKNNCQTWQNALKELQNYFCCHGFFVIALVWIPMQCWVSMTISIIQALIYLYNTCYLFYVFMWHVTLSFFFFK